MFDIFFFVLFGFVLYLTLLGELIMKSLDSLFGFEVGLPMYLLTFAMIGVITRLTYELQFLWIRFKDRKKE